MHEKLRVVLDANLLAPVVKRAVWQSLTAHGLVAPSASPRILAEAEYTVQKIGAKEMGIPLRFEGLLIIDPKETEGINLPDPDDLHVLELALEVQAAMIVTENIRDFPKKTLAPLGLCAMNANQFLYSLYETAPERVNTALMALPEHLQADFLTSDTLLTILKRAGFKRVVNAIKTPPHTG